MEVSITKNQESHMENVSWLFAISSLVARHRSTMPHIWSIVMTVQKNLFHVFFYCPFSIQVWCLAGLWHSV